MAANVRGKLFGEVSLYVGADRVSLRLTSSQKLVALLAISQNRRLARSEAGRMLWPGEDEAIARGRLRTALTQLRSSLGEDSPVRGDKNTIWLQPENLSFDLWDASRAHRAIQSLPSELDEYARLAELEQILDAEFMPAFSDPWIVAERRRWIERRRDSILRIIQIEEEWENLPSAVRWSEKLLLEFPQDELAWLARFRVASLTGGVPELKSRFHQTRSVMRASGEASFSSEMIFAVQTTRTQQATSKRISEQESHMLRRTMNTLLDTAPDEALAFLGSMAFRDEVFKHPLEAGRLCQKAVDSTSDFDEPRLRCIANALIAANLLNDHVQITRMVPWLLEHDSNLARRRGAATVLANTLFALGEFEEAFQLSRTALQLAEELGNQDGIILARTQLGILHENMLEFEPGESILRACLKDLRKTKDRQSMVGICSALIALSWGSVVQRKLAESLKHLGRCLSLSRTVNYQGGMAVCLGLQGTVRVLMGEEEAGVEQIAEALAFTYRSLDEPLVPQILEATAMGLAKLNLSVEARDFLHATSSWRASIGYEASPLAARWRSQVLELLPVSVHVSLGEEQVNLKELTATVCRLLTKNRPQ